jgi:hypothetical protein
LRPQIVAVEGEQVEAIGKHVCINAARDQLIKIRHGNLDASIAIYQYTPTMSVKGSPQGKMRSMMGTIKPES